MLFRDENRNLVNGILGTIAFHLLLLVLFLFLKLGKVKTLHKEAIVIEFADETFKPIEKIIEESKPKEVEITSLSDQAMRNIAVNTAEKVNEKISTEKYEQEVMKELGMESIKQNLDRVSDDDITLDKTTKPKEKKEKKTYAGPTRISYNLKNRTDRYMYIPVYKCQGYGDVTVNIVVNPEGRVIQASLKSSSTSETCIVETALEAARLSYFNIDQTNSRQKGTITYSFVAQ